MYGVLFWKICVPGLLILRLSHSGRGLLAEDVLIIELVVDHKKKECSS